jgi:N-acetylgalactosamine kinase
MQSSSLHKVCFPIDGKPAINRAIEIYNACGIQHHVVVVGTLAGQVVETVGREFDNAVFAYQPEPLGTADAASVGLRALEALGRDEDVLLVPGDRLIDPAVLERLFDAFYSNRCHLALVAAPPNKGSGRIVRGADGALLAIAEMPDVRQRRVLGALRARLSSGEVPSGEELRRLIIEGFSGGGPEPAEAKLQAAFGELWGAVSQPGHDPRPEELEAWIPSERTRFEFRDASGASVRLTPDEVAAAPLVNVSVYVAAAPALRHALSLLDSDNAQRERYLTDIVEVLSRSRGADGEPFRLEVLEVTDPGSILGYNDPAELLEVEAHIRAPRGPANLRPLSRSEWFRPIRDWRKAFARLREGTRGGEKALREELTELYGREDDVIAERVAAYGRLLEYGSDLLGEAEPVFLVRSPGRVNAMGRHIDHQGGRCNLMTIGFETLMLAHPRRDDRIRLFNLDRERFSDCEFSIGAVIGDLPWDDWLSLVNSERVSSMLRMVGGHWSQYVMAAVLRLQKRFADRPLRGMDFVVSGNVPAAAGLSSSSSIVVGAAEAAIALNRLNTSPAEIVDLCGEGEWFVGTRGGSADHAAVKLGQKGKVIRVSFFDFAIEDAVPFPRDHVMVVCDSGIRAEKASNAKDHFNHRVSCYRIGLALIRRIFPQLSPVIEHLRDVDSRKLGLPLSWTYEMLLQLPDVATTDQLRQMLPEEELAPLLATHETPADGIYPIRGVVLYGLAECERASRFAPLLREGQIDEIGRMMNVSHDGDRISRFSREGQEEVFRAPTTDGYLLGLIEDLESSEPARVQRAQLHQQPGRYGCSVPEIDRMVDISTRTSGVAGAQLAGAGLGGCMMVLAHADAVDTLRAEVTEQYYERAGRPPRILICRPVAGAGILMKTAGE